MLKSKTPQKIEITGAKGRPMLSWGGKRPLDFLEAFPAQKIETFGSLEPQSEGWDEWPSSYPHGGVLLHGDNKECLAHLLHAGFRGQVKLIYIDPPFDSGADYVRKVNLRGIKGQAVLEGQEYSLGEQIQYTDIWANDNYLQFMFERLLLLKELLAEDGSIYLHCDDSKNHHLRCLLDEVFGSGNFLNEIIHCYGEREKIQRNFNRKHQTIYWYAKDANSKYVFNAEKVREEYAPATLAKYKYEDENGVMFRIRGVNQAAAGELRAKTDLRLEDESEYTYRDYLGARSGPAPRDWFVKPFLNQAASERLADYPTQKNPAVLERVIAASSNPGDIVLDCFLGSGTTAAVAQKLGRRFIGCDINKGAIQTASKRLQNIITEQKKANGKMLDEYSIAPVQAGFSVWRVNDYDLNVQHLEAVELACARAGVSRTRSDAFFDGTLGDKLVKIVPFQHALSPADIEAVKSELKTRPEETRSIVLVALGVESAARVALAEWNQYSVAARCDEQGNAVDYINKIEALDLREGGFFVHQNAVARVSAARWESDPTRAKIEIQDFASPTIVTRLQKDSNIFAARADGWKSCVDCVLIDLNYNGEIFNVSVSDIPAKKDALVRGVYEVEVGALPVTIAVKIIDLLGEEVVTVLEV